MSMMTREHGVSSRTALTIVPAPTHWVPAFMLRGFWDEMLRRGVSVPELERLSGVRRARCDDVFSTITEEDESLLFEVSMLLTGDANLGLSVGRAIGPLSFHLLGHIALASPTLQQAVELGAGAQPQLGPRFPMIDDPGDGTLRIGVPADATELRAGARFRAEMTAVLLHDLVLHFLSKEAAPTTVQFAFAAPSDLTPYRRVFAGEVGFEGDGTFVCFPKSALVRRRSGADAMLAQQLSQMAREQYGAAIGTADDWTSRVRRALRAHRAPRLLDAEELASRLQLSARGLARRLAREGASLSTLIDAELYERAQSLLCRPGATTTSVASDLGYAECSSFFRAFRRWSGGLTPTAYRRHQQRLSRSNA